MPPAGSGTRATRQLRDAIAPLVTHINDTFGPHRSFWSSNFPIDKPNVSLPDSIQILREILGCTLDDRAMLVHNARDVYRIRESL